MKKMMVALIIVLMILGCVYAVCAEETTVSVRDFFGLQHVDAKTAVISAVMNDCEEGPIEETMSEEDRDFMLDLLDRGVIIGLENEWSVTGGTTSYIFRDTEGNYLGSIELYQGLAVGRDGMYKYALPPVSEEKPQEEEQR